MLFLWKKDLSLGFYWLVSSCIIFHRASFTTLLSVNLVFSFFFQALGKFFYFLISCLDNDFQLALAVISNVIASRICVELYEF